MEIEVEISSLQMHHLRSDNDSVLIIPSISDVEYILFRCKFGAKEASGATCIRIKNPTTTAT